MIHLSTWDVILIGVYFCGVLYVGFRSARGVSRTDEDFLLAGRSLTLPIFVMTLVSTWYGGILGVGEFSYRYGISNWFLQGVPYYVFAALFAFLLAGRIRATNLVSIPDKLAAAYGTKTALLGSVLTFFLMTPAPYVLMLGIFLQMLFGWNLLIGVSVTAAVGISYLFVGGFHADVATDVLEFVLMFAGFAVILPFCFFAYGGWDFLAANLPEYHLVWHGGHSPQYIIVWFFIALWTLVDPAFHQRCYAAKDGWTARNGILVSIVFWFLFDCMTATVGLYARAALPGLENPMMAYPLLAETLLPPVAKGLFYIGMLATIMSTLNTLALVSAQTLGRDIILRWRNRLTVSSDPASSTFTSVSSKPYIQAGLIVAFVISAVVALLIPSVVEIWYTVGTVIVPGLLVPLLASYFPSLRISSGAAFMAMMFGWLVSLAWLLLGKVGNGYPFGIEPMYPGLGVAVMIWGVGRVRAVLTE